jgi:hypothetical protein
VVLQRIKKLTSDVCQRRHMNRFELLQLGTQGRPLRFSSLDRVDEGRRSCAGRNGVDEPLNLRVDFSDAVAQRYHSGCALARVRQFGLG